MDVNQGKMSLATNFDDCYFEKGKILAKMVGM